MTPANRVFVDQIVAHLPHDLQALYQNPPKLSDPSSFLPIIRTVLPYTKYVVVLLAFYIVWSTIAGLFGYFSRFVRFALRIGPILGIIAWVMSNSGQGGMDELFDMVKQWTGLAPQNNRAGTSPGIASLAGLFGGSGNSRQRRSSGRRWVVVLPSPSWLMQLTHPRSGRRGATSSGDSDFISSLLNSATGSGRDADWQGVAQDYVRDALAKASGMGWLFGGQNGNQDEADAETKRKRSR
jgi:hypothetical protein